MPWVSVDGAFAASPRLDELPVTTSVATVDDLDTVGDWTYLDGRLVEDGEALLRDERAVRLESAVVRRTALGDPPPPRLEATRCVFEGCNLGSHRFEVLTGCRFSDCGMTGLDLSDADVTDVVFERCVVRLANLRMARLRRVQFLDCQLIDVDAFEMQATDVSFDDSHIERLNVDRLRAARVDLRGALTISFEASHRLDGCLVRESQLIGLAYELAAAVGLDVEPDT